VLDGHLLAMVRLRDAVWLVGACKVLCCWRHINSAERVEIAKRTQERAWNREYETPQTEGERRERLRLRAELHASSRIYEDLDDRLHKAGPSGSDSEKYWGALPPTLDCLRLDE